MGVTVAPTPWLFEFFCGGVAVGRWWVVSGVCGRGSEADWGQSGASPSGE